LNVHYSQTLTPNPAPDAPYSFVVTGGSLPLGLTLASSGELSGTPTQTGIFNFTLTATGQSGGCSSNQASSLTVNGPSAICSYSLSPTGGAVPTGGGRGDVLVQTQ